MFESLRGACMADMDALFFFAGAAEKFAGTSCPPLRKMVYCCYNK